MLNLLYQQQEYEIMEVQSTSAVNFGNGVYYTKTALKGINLKDGIASVSKEGFKFIENAKLDGALKERFESADFIQFLSKDYDTFIKYGELGPSKTYPDRHVAFAQIFWGDKNSGIIDEKTVVGESHSMIQKAINNMFKNLSGQRFSDVSFKHFV